LFTAIKKKLCALGFVILCFTNLQAGNQNQVQQAIAALIPKGAVVLHDEQGTAIIEHNPDKVLVPASIIKIIIVQATYDLLGPAFRFKTEFYQDLHENLAIKGWGDPFLLSEDISKITKALQQKNLVKIHSVVLDSSSFAEEVAIPGTSNTLNPYDALNGALVVNFNTLNVGVTLKGKPFSAEPETPLTPLAVAKSDLIGLGKIERINLTKHEEESLLYVGQLFSEFFRQAGIRIEKEEIRSTVVDSDWRLIYQHFNSRSLETIFSGLMKYSNNFIANQVFLVLGSEVLGYPASLAKSRQVLRTYIKNKWGFLENEITLDEASGISRKNGMTARQMISILESFKPYSDLLSEKNNLRIKSGTLTGVYNYAGYFETNSGLRPFVIMTNQSANKRDALLKLLLQTRGLTAALPADPIVQQQN
jgi:D-alanyl-D-alanine carboxypeptidase/D-alanyl-D-alanine-endopeptidase (penicillin-binding protein 4)